MADYADLVTTIQQKAGAFDRSGVAAACDQLVERMQDDESPAPVKPLKKALGLLRNKRYFNLMVRVADAAVQSGQDDPQIQRQLAQGLIDQGNLSAAVNLLTVLASSTATGGPLANPAEHAEARGLLGRAFKQAYVDAVNHKAPGTPERAVRARANRKNLERAIAAYHEVYEMDRERHLWHGINTVACVCRATRDGLAAEAHPDARAIAAAILDSLESRAQGDVPVWDRATAVEACVALDRLPQALDWLAVYAPDPAADAFELASTLRQMEEVWELTPASTPGSAILPILHSELLKREGGGVALMPAPAAGAASTLSQERMAAEALLGDTRFVSLEWYRTGLRRCEAVARFETQWGQAFGSGFLVRGEDLHPTLGGEVLLLTNAHVVSDDPVVQYGSPRALPPDQVRVTFQGRDDAKKYEVKELLWTSPPGELDATLLRLQDSLAADPPYPLAIKLPVVDVDRVYVIGHPQGGPLSISMQDNRVVDVHDPKIQYRAPTEPGSSGSPVFNQDWQLVALHHAGSTEMPRLGGQGVVEANEGIWINAVVAAIRQKYDAAARKPAPARRRAATTTSRRPDRRKSR